MDRRGSASVLWCIVIYCTCVVVTGVFTDKAFFCRDPDTGKLHPVNSTWYSSSFCGKYTCKLRKKEQVKPVTHQKFAETTDKGATQPASVTVPDGPNGHEKHEITEGKQKNKINWEKFRKVNESKNIQQPASTLDEDRYLSQEEIAALSLLLQTMKKSDLEAILEVYNLAQDIYKELDKIDKAQDVTVDEKSNDSITIDKEVVNKKTYWYDPLTAASSNKIKEAAEIVDVEKVQRQVQNTPVPVNIKPIDAPKKNYVGLNGLQKLPAKQNVRKPKTKMEEQAFFEGPLVRNYNMRMLPYYHPLTNFQKLASYIRPKASIAQSPNYSPSESYSHAGIIPTAYIQLQQYPLLSIYSNQPKEVQKAYQMQQQKLAEKTQYFYPQHKKDVKPENQRAHGKCSKSKSPYKAIPLSELAKKTNAIMYDEKRKTYSNSDKTYEQKDVLSLAESKLMAAHNLDLPFAYQQNYNASNFNPQNSQNVWTMFRLDTKFHKPPPQRGYLTHIARDDMSDTVVNEEIKEELQSIEESKETQNSNELPDWQTAPLSITDLNEVKANIARSKFLPYPFRRKVTLERVGRFRNIPDGGRTKRDVKKDIEKDIEASQQVYEVYIEKSTCHTDTEPGFFRMGNASEPFPACCPQRILS